MQSHRFLDVVPGVLGSPVHPGVVDDHVLYDGGHLMFQLEIRHRTDGFQYS